MALTKQRGSVASMAFKITDLLFNSCIKHSQILELKKKHGIKKLFRDADLKQLEAFHDDLEKIVKDKQCPF